MISKDDQCYFCKNLAIETRRVCIDAEPDHDDWGGMTMIGLYAEVSLCEEHCLEEEGTLYEM